MVQAQYHQPEPDEVLAGTYRLSQQLAQGGFAAVWHAQQLDSGQPVAIKFMLPTRVSDEATVKRFEREARLMLRLLHPNIVKVLDYGVTEPNTPNTMGIPYLVMELLKGQTLEQFLERDPGPITLGRAIAITAPVLDALSEAHALGIIHRDLKPDNIFIVGSEASITSDEPLEIKLIDFGICKPLDFSPLLTGSDQLTKTDQVFGTPDYMAPEQISAEPLFPATDIYAIGIILYELLVGQRPFVSTNAVKTMIMHLDEPMPPLPQPYDEHPIQALITQSTHKSPHGRIASAAELKRGLMALPPAPDDAVDRVRITRNRGHILTPDTRIFAKRRKQVEDIGSLPTLDAETPARLRPPPTFTPSPVHLHVEPSSNATRHAVLIAIISALLACVIVALLLLR
ncbi:MAG: serine/threonine-protein kinase [Myxococcota bacterium]